MILATHKILEIFSSNRKPDFTIVSALVSCVEQFGNISAADVLLDCFLADPTDSYRADLLCVIDAFGDFSHTQKLIGNCFNGKKLKKDYPTEILHTLGYIGDENSVELLLHNALYENDYYSSKDAVLGLLHFDCGEFESQILAAIEETYEKNLFNEFVPALVCKLSEPTEVLENLFKYGSTITSADCNSGVILGFSLCGKIGEEYFRKALWHPFWEANCGATGTVHWAYFGTQNLGITLSELYQEVKNSETDALAHRLSVIEGLLKDKIGNVSSPLRFIKPIEESFEAIYENIFAWETPNEANNIEDLGKKLGHLNRFFELRRKLEFRLQDEMLHNYKNKLTDL